MLMDFHRYGNETSFLPSVRPIRKRRAGKQSFTQDFRADDLQNSGVWKITLPEA